MGTVDDGWLFGQLTELAALAAFATDLVLLANDIATLTEFGRLLYPLIPTVGFGQLVPLDGGRRRQVPGSARSGLNLMGSDLNGVNDYRTVLAEILEKRCETSSVNRIFPGVPSGRMGVVRPR
jgi:hypothetical protein